MSIFLTDKENCPPIHAQHSRLQTSGSTYQSPPPERISLEKSPSLEKTRSPLLQQSSMLYARYRRESSLSNLLPKMELPRIAHMSNSVVIENSLEMAKVLLPTGRFTNHEYSRCMEESLVVATKPPSEDQGRTEKKISTYFKVLDTVTKQNISKQEKYHSPSHQQKKLHAKIIKNRVVPLPALGPYNTASLDRIKFKKPVNVLIPKPHHSILVKQDDPKSVQQESETPKNIRQSSSKIKISPQYWKSYEKEKAETLGSLHLVSFQESHEKINQLIKKFKKETGLLK